MKHSFKKLVSLVLALAISLALSVPAFAETKEAEVPITPDTIVTEDNQYEVLKYLNIDLSNVVKSNVNEIKQGVTVAELKQAIEQVKKRPSKIDTNSTGKKYSAKTTNSALRSPLASALSQGTVMLYYDFNADGFIISYEVAGNYSGSKWTGASSASVSVDGNQAGGGPGIISYKIGSKNLRLSYTPSLITLNAKVTVDTYIGIGSVTTKIRSQDSTTMATWDTSYI